MGGIILSFIFGFLSCWFLTKTNTMPEIKVTANKKPNRKLKSKIHTDNESWRKENGIV